MSWEVLNMLKKYRSISFLQLLGQIMPTAKNCTVLLKDNDGNAVLVKLGHRHPLPQKHHGFAKGCLLLKDDYGPGEQNTKGLYENVGTAKLARFNVIGQVQDPEIVLAKGHLLIGNIGGLAHDVTLTGDVVVTYAGVTSINLADNKFLIGGVDNKAHAQTLSGDLTSDRTGAITVTGISLADDKFLIGGVDGKAHAQTLSGDLTCDRTGLVTITGITLADGKFLIGGVDGKGHAQTLSGDLTITNAGVATVAGITLADAKIMVGGVDGKSHAQTVSGVITLANTGAVAFAATHVYSHRCVLAGQSASENDSNAEVIVSNAAINAGDIAICTIAAQAGTAYIKFAVVTEDTLTITLSGNGGAGTIINYMILRAVG